MSNEKSLSLALEIAKKARAKGKDNPDDIRKARLRNFLFGLGDDDTTILSADAPQEEVSGDMESAPAPKAPTRKERLMRILGENTLNLNKKSDV